MLANRLWDEIQVGDTASVTRRCTADDLYSFANASGNHNPLHLPHVDWTGDGKIDEPIVPSLWIASIASAVIGNRLPGPGALWRQLALDFSGTVRLGEAITATVTVAAKEPGHVLAITMRVTNAEGAVVAEGQGRVSAPAQKLAVAEIEIPEMVVSSHRQFDALVALAKGLPPLVTAVVAPDDPLSLAGALMARDAGLITPILIGLHTGIKATAREIGADLAGVEIIDMADDDTAAARAIAMVHAGRVQAVMKGHLHSDVILRHVVKADGGLRSAKRISHVFVMDVPGRPTPILISDAAMNIAPDLDTKVDIVQNAIDLARAIGIAEPRVGILSAVETVNPKIPSSVDAAVLSKMAERGQITGGIVDGPLAMDNAINVEAAHSKGITSLVAGHADVLIVPNLETGNMLAKELTFLAHAQCAGLVVGAQVPIMLTSRADDRRSRLASCALALLYAHFRLTGRPFGSEPTRL